MLFGAVFGPCGGLFNTFDAVFTAAEIPLDYSVVGIAFTVVGLYLACMLPAVNRTAKADCFIFFFGACGVLSSGLTVLGICRQHLIYSTAGRCSWTAWWASMP